MTEQPTEREAWLPPALLRAVWADPGRLPEVMALFAVRHLGTGAATAARERRAAHPEATRKALDADTVVHGTRVTIAEGAFVGGPFVFLIPVAFCAALLGQARMVLELAALHGRNTDSDARAADLLVLQGAYPDLAQATTALDDVRHRATTTAPGQHDTGEPPPTTEKRPRGLGFATLMRMAAVLGLITPDTGAGRIRRALGWLYVAALVTVGILVPVVWIPAMAWSYKRATTALGRRAAAYYAGAGPDAPDRAPLAAPGRFDPLGVATAVRAIAAVAVPLAAVAFVVLTDIRIGDSKFAAAGVALVVSAQVAATAWIAHRWWRIKHPKPRR